MSQREGVTLFILLLAAFQVLLARYSGQEDIVVGSPIANRTRPELEGLMGFFVNTLVLRTDLSGNPTFRQVLRRVREVTLQAYAHQDLPFEKLVEELNPRRSLSHHPLFQVAFALHNTPTRPLEFSGVEVLGMDFKHHPSQFDLSLSFFEHAGSITGSILYDCDLFEEETIRRFVDHYQWLLRCVVASSEQHYSALPVLTAQEERQLLVDWNATKQVHPQIEAVHALVEKQAEYTADAIAVVYEEEHLTYGALNRRADRIAGRLQAFGLRAEAVVGIYLQRSVTLVEALLGVLKAGGAYLPLDLSAPPSRTAYIVSNADVAVLLTQRHLLSRLPGAPTQVLCMDMEDCAEEHGVDLPSPSSVSPDNLAYVVYTSGSTGRPKGVQITHSSLLNLVFWHQRAFSITETDRATQIASPAFDAMSWEIWPYLTCGASVHLPSEEIRVQPSALCSWLIERDITVSFLPTPLAEAILYLQWPSPCSLRFLLTGGDTLQHYPPVHLQFTLVNNYGPTEATVVATSAPITPNEQSDMLPTIGRPIANTAIYLLDAHLRPVPIGVRGEVYIGGCGLARGYLHLPEQTAERFIPNPFSKQKGARLYKTGDLARYHLDGRIEFLGRNDDQIKLRGYRIELGEIQSILVKHPAVRDAIVVARSSRAGQRHLVAYVVPREDRAIAISELRRHLQEDLPEYMIPTAFVILEEFPLTPHQKIDTRVLPVPDLFEVSSTSIGPRTLTEMQLMQAWEELLEVEHLDVTDNFFTVGGHSLLAVRLVAIIEERLCKKLPLAALFGAGTIEQLATLLDREEAQAAKGPLIPIQPRGTCRPFFFAHPIGGHVFSYIDLARALGPDQPFYGFQAPGLQAECKPLARVEELATLYLEALHTVQPRGPYAIGGWSFGGIVALEMALQLQQRGESADVLILLDSIAPGLQKDDGQHDELLWLYDLAQSHAVPLPGSIHEGYEQLETGQERLDYSLDQAFRMRLLPDELSREKAAQFIRVFCANRQAYRTYSPRASYGGRTLLVRGKNHVDHGLLYWQTLIPAIRVVTLPVTHYSMIRWPQVGNVAKLLKPLLRQERTELFGGLE